MLLPSTARRRLPLTGKTLHLDFSDDGVVTIASDLFTSIVNRASAGGSFTAAGAARPAVALINGRRAALFNGSSTVMASTIALSSVFGASAKEIFIVTNPVISTAFGPLICSVRGGAEADWQVRVRSTANGFQHVTKDGAGFKTAPIATTAVPQVLHGYHDGTNITLDINDGTAVTASAGATATMTGVLSIGAEAAYSRWHNGIIGEMVGYNAILTPAQRTLIINYLKKKWGI